MGPLLKAPTRFPPPPRNPLINSPFLSWQSINIGTPLFQGCAMRQPPPPPQKNHQAICHLRCQSNLLAIHHQPSNTPHCEIGRSKHCQFALCQRARTLSLLFAMLPCQQPNKTCCSAVWSITAPAIPFLLFRCFGLALGSALSLINSFGLTWGFYLGLLIMAALLI